MAVLRRIKRAMVRAMCGAKLMEKKRTEDLQNNVGIEGNSGLDGKDGHVLRRDDGHVLRKMSEFEVKGKRERG